MLTNFLFLFISILIGDNLPNDMQTAKASARRFRTNTLPQSLAADAAPRRTRQRLANTRVNNEAARIAFRVCK